MSPLTRKSRKLLALLTSSRQFQIKIADLLLEVDYDESIEEGVFICYQGVHLTKSAFPGCIIGMAHSVALVNRYLPGGKRQSEVVEVPYGKILCVLNVVENNQWALRLHQECDGHTRITEVMVGNDLPKLVQVQRDMVNLAGYEDVAGSYRIEKVNA